MCDDLSAVCIFTARNERYIYPGLNTPVMKGSEVLKSSKKKADPAEEERIIKMRDQYSKVAVLCVLRLRGG